MESLVIDTEDVVRMDGDPMDDVSAYWYAWGRLDAGDAPVVVYPTHSPMPSPTATAWHFGRQWAKLRAEQERGQRLMTPGIPTAWDNYVASGGRSLDA